MYWQLALVTGVVLLLAAVWFVRTRRSPAAAAKTGEAVPAPATPAQSESEQGVTVVKTRPIGVDDESMDYADSEITADIDLGCARAIVFEEELADEDEDLKVTLRGAVGLTHQGRRRKDNQDRFLVLESHHLFVVADGMGGYAGGQVAAQLAVDTIRKAFETNDFSGGTPLSEVPLPGSQLAASIQMANRAIWKRANQDEELQQMGTTVVAGRFSPDLKRLYIGHVGDSRCYRWRADKLEQVTSDHTMGNEGLDGPLADHLTRAVGIAPAVEVDVILVRPRPGDSYLLCSDGLNKMVPDDEIAEVLRTAASTEVAVEALVNRANARGGRDNITVVLVRAVDPTPVVVARGFGGFLSPIVDDEDEMPTVVNHEGFKFE